MKWVFRIFGLLVLVMIILILIRPSSPNPTISQTTERRQTPADQTGRSANRNDPGTSESRGSGLNREVQQVILTKHARCRMGCRSISEAEVMDILKNGEINYPKSDLRGNPDPKYAVEGRSADGQNLRIIFAQSPRGVVVVTVIDLGREWQCNCK